MAENETPLSTSTTSPVFKGYEAEVQVADITIGRAMGVSYTISNNVDVLTLIGTRVQLLKEGPISVSGDIRLVLIDQKMLSLSMGTTDPAETHSAMMDKSSKEIFGREFLKPLDIVISIVDTSIGETERMTITLHNCYFDTWSAGVDENGFYMEDVRFVAKTISYTQGEL